MRTLVTCLLVLAAGCGSDGGVSIDPGERAGHCADDTRVGAFEIALNDGFTSVQGTVADAVAPTQITEVVATEGDCVLVQPPALFCDPVCGSGTTCDASGSCVPAPQGVSVGTVTVDGLASAVEMTASPPVFFYTNTGTLEHPGFAEGADIVLTASGAGDIEPFALGVGGVAPLALPQSSVALDADQPVTVTWSAPGVAGAARISLELDIAQHGGTPAAIACDVADTGSFEIPVALTNQLLELGFSGFPSLAVVRESVDSTDTAVGCVELSATSAAVYDVDIPGLTSCSDDNDCTPPETCQPDLTCG